MRGVLVDTDILIEVLCGRNTAILKRFEELLASGLPVFYTPVTAAEIWHWARREEEQIIARFLDSLACLPLDAATGVRAGRYLHRYRRSRSVELGDALIAAAAAQHGLPLWTRNRKHYPMQDLEFY